METIKLPKARIKETINADGTGYFTVYAGKEISQCYTYKIDTDHPLLTREANLERAKTLVKEIEAHTEEKSETFIYSTPDEVVTTTSDPQADYIAEAKKRHANLNGR